MIKFDFTVTIGNILTFVSFLGVVIPLLSKLNTLIRKLDWFLIEHEMLVQDYCKAHDIETRNLPTRSMRPRE